MYTQPDFNYIGYNTIRMYDSRLAQPEYVNRPLWDKIIGIIPYYQREFGIDGVMIDMGHALPMELKKGIVEAARSINPDFAFWDENFITRKSVEEGYNAVFGFLWIDQHHPSECVHSAGDVRRKDFPYRSLRRRRTTCTAPSHVREGVRYAMWSWLSTLFFPEYPLSIRGSSLRWIVLLTPGSISHKSS
jgi:hypothetical protein